MLVGRTPGAPIGGGAVLNPDNFIAIDNEHLFTQMKCESAQPMPGYEARACYKYSNTSGRSWAQVWTEKAFLNGTANYTTVPPTVWGNGPFGMARNADGVLHSTENMAFNVPGGCNEPAREWCSVRQSTLSACNISATPMSQEFRVNASTGELYTVDTCKGVQWTFPWML